MERDMPGFDIVNDRVAFYATVTRVPEELLAYIPADARPDEFFIFTMSPEDTAEAFVGNYKTWLKYVVESNVVQHVGEIYEDRLGRLAKLPKKEFYNHILEHEQEHVAQEQEFGVTSFTDTYPTLLDVLSEEEVIEVLELGERVMHHQEVGAIAVSYGDKPSSRYVEQF
jgi:hypothetical protein